MLRPLRLLRDIVLRLRRARRRRRFPAPRAFRYERFGGIAQLGGRSGWPQALVFVDHDRAQHLGYGAPPPGLWPPSVEPSADPASDSSQAPALSAAAIDDLLRQPLSAPLEAHLQLTNRCAAGCKGCYTGATVDGAPQEWGLAEWCRALDELAEAGVFHVALGGGESALLPWLDDLLRYARRRGIVPNLTTSGLYPDEVLQRVCRLAEQGLFGQINVSIDGVHEDYARVRGIDGFAQADRALVALRRVSPDVGINCVLTRDTFSRLPQLFSYGRSRDVSEIEVLRFKPAGRGARREVYQNSRCSDEQHRALLPTVLSLSRQHGLRVRLDCSFTPMVVHHQPPRQIVQFLCIYGCAAGDLLVAARSSGQLSACSFFASTSARVDRLRAYQKEPAAFPEFQRYRETPPEPCRSCEYRALCRGGCRAVAQHIHHDAHAPDPECPRVIDWQARTAMTQPTQDPPAAQPGDPPTASATDSPAGSQPLTQCAKRRLPVLA
ncbi:MAG: radical SAM protein [Myxococcales bacterium]|nr:radical SAM protein [Myxococcales bacterium]